MTSPFGNGQGATNESGASSGANDFTENPTGNGRKVAMDHNKLFQNRPQKMGKSEVNKSSIPAGGLSPLTPVAAVRKPFKLSGGASGGEPEEDVE
jgi:hypothetical protein